MSALNGQLILVVDDETLMREVIVDELQSFGATVIEAECGKKAFELAKRHSFNAVIADLHMPNGDGKTLLKKFNEERGNTKTFLCTGSIEFTEKDVDEMNLCGVFEKPFKTEKIIHDLNKTQYSCTFQKKNHSRCKNCF